MKVGGAAMNELDYLIYEMYVLNLASKEKILKNCFKELSRLEVPKHYWLTSINIDEIMEIGGM